MKKILITGGAGFVGTLLSKKLLDKGYLVSVLDTKKSTIEHSNLESHIVELSGDIVDENIVEDIYAVVNLAGAPIFGRFTEKYKDIIYKSRIETTKNILNAFSVYRKNLSVFVSASAIGYYGNTNGKYATEEFQAGKDFLSNVCVAWEKEASRAEGLNARLVILRTAHVMGKGGIFSVLSSLFKINIGGFFGKGIQHMPWVGAEDLVDMYIFAIENEKMQGVYNTAADNPTQKDFMEKIRRSIGSLFNWPVPVFIARFLYLGFVDSLIVDIMIDSSKIKKAGFVFQQNDLFEVCKKSLI
jgi:uncharacterized protein (TIGR01777 family)